MHLFMIICLGICISLYKQRMWPLQPHASSWHRRREEAVQGFYGGEVVLVPHLVQEKQVHLLQVTPKWATIPGAYKYCMCYKQYCFLRKDGNGCSACVKAADDSDLIDAIMKSSDKRFQATCPCIICICPCTLHFHEKYQQKNILFDMVIATRDSEMEWYPDKVGICWIGIFIGAICYTLVVYRMLNKQPLADVVMS